VAALYSPFHNFVYGAVQYYYSIVTLIKLK